MMLWLTGSSLQSALPQHCEPANDFLLRFSSTFHVCVPTPLAFLSNLLGNLSILAWLFAQLPQVYKNWQLQSTAGLSVLFLAEWFLGDVTNLLGALFTHQASWQVAIGSYYTFVDSCLIIQWIWYEKLRQGSRIFRMKKTDENDHNGGGWTDGTMEQVVIEGMPVLSTSTTASSNRADKDKGQEEPRPQSRPKIIFRQPTFQRENNGRDEKSSSPGSPTLHRVVPSSSMPSPSPRTVLLIACLVAIAQASPLAKPSLTSHSSREASAPTLLENIGAVLSWMSTLLYLGSRLPQIFKNWRRKSTAGLSPLLFFAAFCGNLFYSTALLTNPCAWNDFGPHGGGGWVGKDGSNREQWTLSALPFFLGAAGCLGMDASVGIQFLMYGKSGEKIVNIGEPKASRWHWRKVSGWMRGWFPSVSSDGGSEREALIQESRDGATGEGYGAL